MPRGSLAAPRLGLGCWLARLAAAVTVALAPARARAEPAELEIVADGCPSAELVRAQLEPLLGNGILLTPDPAGSADRQQARVRDLGTSYRIEVGAQVREADDPSRNCQERARVAAVFIALNLRAPPPEPLPKPAPTPPIRPSPAPEIEPQNRREPPSRGARVGGYLFVETAYAPGPRLVTIGPGAGLSLGSGAWFVAGSASVLAPVELTLEPGSTATGAVSIIRIPLALTVTPSLRVGALELGPVAGVALDVLSIRGERLAQPESSIRANPGASLGLGARWLLSRRWWAFATASATGFPIEYRLRVEPTGTLGRTPRTWLGFALGIGGSSPP